jgi:antagonist of KipI
VSLRVVEAGFQTLVVDGGRACTRHLGVPLGGAADCASLAVANALVGNSATTTALEITLRGPTLQATAATACALFGASFAMAVANKGRIEPATSFTLQAGDTLKIGGTPAGLRAYLAVAGGLHFAEVMGSRSSFDALTAGTTLSCAESQTPQRGLPFDHWPLPRDGDMVILRTLPGPQHSQFLKPKEFFDHEYEITPESNRMGLRLKGRTLERRMGELTSEAVAPGTVQVTNDGLPVILGVDGQTIGGYPKIAQVIRADLDILGRVKPGDRVRFRAIGPEEAAAVHREQQATLNEWLTRLLVTCRAMIVDPDESCAGTAAMP